MFYITHNAHLIAVFHELGEVEQCLRDLGDVLWRQRLLETLDQLVLLSVAQLRPARHERSVEQLADWTRK